MSPMSTLALPSLLYACHSFKSGLNQTISQVKTAPVEGMALRVNHEGGGGHSRERGCTL